MQSSNLKTLFSFIGLLLLATVSFAQTELGIPIKKQEGFVLEFKSPFEQLALDIGENNFTTKENTVFTITPQTTFVNKKDKPLDRNVIRPGMLVEITGERFTANVRATKVKLKIDLEKWEIEVKGYFESLDGDGKAWIDGQAVRLAPGAVIRGDDQWKNKTFSSFNEMMLGSIVSVKGMRKTDGIVYVSSGKTAPNMFSNGDRNLISAVQKSVFMPASLAGGKGKVLGREVKFADSLELQTYVTKIGYKLIPRYQKDLPKDYPGKLVYRFAVIEDDSFNAFALPDGSIFIHTGLLKQVKSEAQLAAILGHEIAHVTHEHSRKRIEDPKGTWLPLAAAIGGAITGNQAVSMLGQLGVQTLLNKYGRDAEDQADRVGLYYMMQAGYDPREAPKVWREITKTVKENAVSNFLYSDHSTARARLKNLNREIAYSYYETDFNQTIVGDKEYMQVVGVYFGWIPKPMPVVKTPLPTIKAKPKPKVKRQKAKVKTKKYRALKQFFVSENFCQFAQKT